MTEEQDKSQAAADSPDPDSAKKNTATEAETDAEQVSGGTREPARGGTGIALVVFALLALAAIGVSLYSVYEMRDLHSRQSVLSEEQDELSADLTEAVANREQLANDLAELQTTLSATTRSLDELRQREKMNNFDWALAEVEYLTIIAMQRLSLARDPDTALAAMEAAARRLRDIDNPALIPVRKQYTEDINALEAVPEIDVPGMALYLGDLITRAEQLPLASDAVVSSETRPAETGESPVSGWRGIVNAIWQELRQLVVIQREDEPPPALMAPDERYYLYQNLRIELASARAAVLRRDTSNLQTSIELIRDWLQRYFDTDAAEVSNVLEALEQMSSREVAPELPDVSSSLESLRAYQRRQADKAEGMDG